MVRRENDRQTMFHAKSFRVLSKPQVTIHGWVGWNSQSSTPTSLCSAEPWQRSIFTGTINGFCIRSLHTHSRQESQQITYKLVEIV